MSADAISAVGQQFLNRVMADDPNSKLDDNSLAVVLAKNADKFPPGSLYSLYAALKQMGQNSADLIGLSPTDAKARIVKALDSTGFLAQAKIDVEKLKDTKELDSFAQNIQIFLQSHYGIQSKRAESEIGLDTSARHGVAEATSTLGWLGKLVLGFEKFFPGVLPPNWVAGARRVVDEAETYTTKGIRSGGVVQSNVDTSQLSGLSTERYENFVTGLSQMFVKGQDVVAEVAAKAAHGSQKVAPAAIAAGTLPTSSPAPTVTPPDPKGQPSLNTQDLTKDLTSHFNDRGFVGRIVDTVRDWISPKAPVAPLKFPEPEPK